MERNCATCVDNGRPREEEPCSTCVDWYVATGRYPRWYPKSTQELPGEAQEVDKTGDSVHHPGHYTRLPIETIKAIKLLVTEVYGDAGYKGYCFGNELKYRLRAGFKDDIMVDIGKALKYETFRKED